MVMDAPPSFRYAKPLLQCNFENSFIYTYGAKEYNRVQRDSFGVCHVHLNMLQTAIQWNLTVKGIN